MEYIDDWTCQECGQVNSEGDDACISCGSTWTEQNNQETRYALHNHTTITLVVHTTGVH